MTVFNSTIVFAKQKLNSKNRSEAYAQIRHSLRSGHDTGRHANPNIDPSRTVNNILLVGGKGGLHEADVDAIAEAEAYYDYQVEQAARAWRSKHNRSMRSDAVRARYGTIQIDPKYWSEGAGNVDEFFRTGVNFLKEFFDERNIVFAAIHMDEISPHLQFMVTLRDYEEDGQLRQGKWFAGQNSYTRIVDACRQFYIDHSTIPTDLSRSGKKSDGLEPAEYTKLRLAAEAKVDAEIGEYIEADYKPKMKKIHEALAREEVERETAWQVDNSEVVRLANAYAQRIREEAEEEREDAQRNKELAIQLSDKALARFTEVNKKADELEKLAEKMKLALKTREELKARLDTARNLPAFQGVEREGDAEFSL